MVSWVCRMNRKRTKNWNYNKSGKSLLFHFENLFARDVLYKEGNHHFSAISCPYAKSNLWIYIKKISLTQREFTLLFKLRTVRLFHFFIAQHLLQRSRQKHIRLSYPVRNHFFINLTLLTTVKKMRAVIDCCCCYGITIFS